MITLYGVSRSRVCRNIWLMKELGQSYTQVAVIQANRLADPNAPGAPLHTKSPEFLAINPNGHIPSMKDGDLVLHESLAINLYLARKFGGALAPANVAEDGLAAMWTLWAVTEVEGHSVQILYHKAMKPVAERDPKVVEASVAALRAPFGVLDKALGEHRFLMGDRFTVVDINVAETVRYAMLVPDLIAEFPHMKAWLERLHARPAFKSMMAMRDAEPA